MAPKMGPNFAFFCSFLQEGEYVKNVLGLEREPFPASLRGSENQLKTHLYKHMFYNPSFLNDTMRKSAKIVPKRGPKTWGDFGEGRSWGTFGATVSFSTQKMKPKCSKNDARGAKVAPKRVWKMRKSGSQRGSRKALNKISLSNHWKQNETDKAGTKQILNG